MFLWLTKTERVDKWRGVKGLAVVQGDSKLRAHLRAKQVRVTDCHLLKYNNSFENYSPLWYDEPYFY